MGMGSLIDLLPLLPTWRAPHTLRAQDKGGFMSQLQTADGPTRFPSNPSQKGWSTGFYLLCILMGAAAPRQTRWTRSISSRRTSTRHPGGEG